MFRIFTVLIKNIKVMDTKVQIKQLQKEKSELIRLLSKMCIFHEKNSSWDKGNNGYYESKRYLNNLLNTFYYVIETDNGSQSKFYPNIIETFSNDEPSREEVIDHNLNIGGISDFEVKYVSKITFLTEEKYNEFIERSGL